MFYMPISAEGSGMPTTRPKTGFPVYVSGFFNVCIQIKLL